MPAAFVLRAAGAEDAPAIVALVESAYRGQSSRAGWTTEAGLLEGQRTDLEAITAVIDAPAARLLVADDGADRLIGCCVIEHRRADLGYFGTFAVVPTLQGGGVGKALLAEAERVCRDEWSCERIEMTVIAQRDDLIAWYARRGYAPSGEFRPFPYGDERFGLPLRDDLHFVVLVKDLS